MKTNIKIALKKYNKGEKFSVSTSIDEDTIILGYGKLDYEFKFPLPKDIVIKEFGATSWEEHFKLKGVNKYLATNLETGEKSITPYFTRDEIFIHKDLNPILKFYNYETNNRIFRSIL